MIKKVFYSPKTYIVAIALALVLVIVGIITKSYLESGFRMFSFIMISIAVPVNMLNYFLTRQIKRRREGDS